MAMWRSNFVLLCRTGEDVLRSVRGSSRWTPSFEQRSGFRKVGRKPESKKGEDELGHLNSSEAASHRRTYSPHWESPPPPSSGTPRAFGRLVRPLLFTVGFTGCSFGSAAIWQYESLKVRVQNYFDELRADWLERVRPQKRGDVRKEVNQWWNSLSEGQRTVTAIVAANVLVFCCWRLPWLQRSMFKYFTADPASKTLCWPMLLSTFSHVSFFHMAANMYVLWSFSSSAVSMLGREQFVAVYLSAGENSTRARGRTCARADAAVCVLRRDFHLLQLREQNGQRAVRSVSGRVGRHHDDPGRSLHQNARSQTGRRLPPDVHVQRRQRTTVRSRFCRPSARPPVRPLVRLVVSAQALKAIVAMDTAGLVLGWRFFDHAAHLGGALFGIWYILYGHERIWMNREPFVKFWHELRTGRGGGNGGERGGSV
ncbi:presenilin-associated rhomboid-like protein, mitochondrial isoform X2 [Phyllopteryx taeniolatus]|uniref:presenilin-associated rhomboid-like protein, mitochondrial isoform X2 n=1 Tax=Phyllopteryx taeniolatus TaxID=161469 RepID=UPI002AD44C15|nr:presenilin-associated rhomboid-like protein, mitochondrial isoform X2 [Phyllopteryx taeniolatus]